MRALIPHLLFRLGFCLPPEAFSIKKTSSFLELEVFDVIAGDIHARLLSIEVVERRVALIL
jgi:hypothetical protein